MLDYAHLDALLAMEREGTLKNAANSLAITQSALSQRITALEDKLGKPVLQRQGRTVRLNEFGSVLCRHAEAIRLQEHRLLEEHLTVGGRHAPTRKPRLKFIVNDDSLSSWFMEALTQEFIFGDRYYFDLVIVDQDHVADTLREGRIHAALTAESAPLPGFNCIYLGEFVYRATASPEFMRRYFPTGVSAQELGLAPALRYSPLDDLQQQWITQELGYEVVYPYHQIPSTHGFVDACLLGMAWGMNPTLLVEEYLQTGRLVELRPGRVLTKPLYWHYSRAVAASIQSFTNIIEQVARVQLVQKASLT